MEIIGSQDFKKLRNKIVFRLGTLRKNLNGWL